MARVAAPVYFDLYLLYYKVIGIHLFEVLCFLVACGYFLRQAGVLKKCHEILQGFMNLTFSFFLNKFNL